MSYYNNMGYRNMEVGVNDRGGMAMLGKVLIMMMLLLVALTGLAVWGWSDHQTKAAEADRIRAATERVRAELAAETPYMPGVEAAEAQQEITRITSEGQTIALQEELRRQDMIQAANYQKALQDETVAWEKAKHQLTTQLLLAAGLAFILGTAGLVFWMLVRVINSQMAARAEARWAVQPVAVAQPVAAAAPAPAARPVARPQPVIGRLPDLPTGQPRRERPTPATQPAAERQPAVVREPADAPAVYNIPAHYWPGMATVAGNGHR